MTTTAQDIRATVTIVGQSQGLEGVSGQLDTIGQAQDRLAQSGQATATVTDIVSRRILSQGSAYERMRASLDPTIRATQQLERGLALADKALRAGQTSAEAHAVVVAQLKARYDATVGSVDAATRSVKNLDQALSVPRQVQIRVDQITGVTRDPGSADRGADIAAYGEELDRVRAKYNPVFALQQQYRAQLEEIARAARTGAISERERADAVTRAAESYTRANRVLQERSRIDDPAAQKRAAQAAVNAQLIVPDRGADVAAYGDQMDRLRAKYVPLYAAQQAYLAQLGEIRDAARTGAMSQAEMAAAVQRTKDAFARQVIDLKAKGAGQLTANQAQNLFYQGTDIATSLAGGMSPMTVLMQQGGQIAPIFAGPGSASVKGALSQAGEAISGVATRLGLVGGAVSLVTAAVLAGGIAWASYASTQRELQVQLSGAGRASRATADQIERIIPAAAAAGNVSVREARQMAGTYAATGRIGTEMYDRLIRSAKDYAATTGQDLVEANKELAGAFASPAKGIDVLNDKLGFATDRVSETVRALDRQGDRLRAQQVLFDAYSTGVTKAADLTSGWARLTTAAGNEISGIWDKIGRNIDKAVTGGTIDQQLIKARRALEGAQVARDGGFGNFSSRDVERRQAEVVRLEAEITKRDKGQQESEQARNSREIGGLVRGLEPDRERLKTLRLDAEKLRKAIADPVKFGLDAAGLAGAQTAFGNLSRSVQSLSEDIEKFGSRAVAAMNRAADLANRTVGFTPGAKSAAEINNRFDALERDADSRELAGLRRARKTELDTLTRERTIGESAPSGAFSRLSTEIQQQILTATQEFGRAPAAIVAAIARRESSGNLNVGFSRELGEDGRPSSAYGLGQITRGAELDIRRNRIPGFDRMDNSQAARGIAAYLDILIERRNGDVGAAVGDYFGSKNPGKRAAYVADVYRKAGQMGDATELGTARDLDANQRAVKAANDTLRLNTELYGRNGLELEAATRASQQYTDMLARGVPPSEALASTLKDLATKAASAAQATKLVQFGRDIEFERDQLGRTAAEQSAYSRARSLTGDTTSDAAQFVVQQSLINERLRETRTLAQDAFSSFTSDIMRGTSATDALHSALSRVADRLLSLASDQIFTNLFKGLMGGGSGGGGGLGQLFNPSSWFSGGGGSGGIDVGATSWMPTFATGGVMTDRGRVPLTRYASGGIASTPQLAMYGEGRLPEAYVPLPDGRSIPVSVRMQREQGGAGAMAAPAAEAPIIVNTTGQPVRTEQVQGPRGPRDAIVIGRTLAGAIMSDPDVHAALSRVWGLRRTGR